MPYARSRRSQVTNYWPGFVDALTSLLLVIVFLLSLFMLAQSFLGVEVQNKDTALSRLNSQIAQLTDMLQLQRGKATDLQSQLTALQATLATTTSERDKLQGQVASLGTGNAGKDAKIADLTDKLSAQKQVSDEATAQVALLNQQLSALRTQIAALEDALDASESRETQSRTAIADLGRRLNLALAQRVQDLSQYRSDFFGELRKVLANRSDIRVVGDRFVFQSEVLFPSGQATIGDQGKQELAQLADALKDIAAKIPPDVHWVLRIDGHTDKRPISTPQFPSNWELSAARAIAVAKFLVSEGIDPKRLVPAGFGANDPIATGDTPEDYAKNRRIEFRLTDG